MNHFILVVLHVNPNYSEEPIKISNTSELQSILYKDAYEDPKE